MSTIREVAKVANVSVATVSRVMNEKGYVSEKARTAVLQAIKQLDYRPNRVARSLFQKRSGLIGLIVPDITNPFFPQLARAVEDMAHQHGFQVILCNTDEQFQKEQEYIQSLEAMHVDGLIITTNYSNNPNYEELEVPIVALDRVLQGAIPTVTSNGHDGGKKAAQFLLDHGATELVVISGPSKLPTIRKRRDGFEEIAGKHLVASIESPFHFQGALGAANYLFDHYDCNGIFAANDVIAAATIQVAAERGIAIPDQLQIIGYDGIELGQMISPPLTTIAQPIYQMGELAAKLLIQRIEGKEIAAVHHELMVEVIERETTKRKGEES
ncbi:MULTISPECIES: LacI family DNA-binding transcriptional regulator [unclassified Exiguobacterium]|uniref:LacI family DNA-binding transcriptional regulator n=1 Tax=unclassified Exiguobacterium TaxID=2644629 RepID=UPI000DF7F119|nr:MULTISPECIES: LacI family DNA-binding transcriptional regulator [unclassified Exiguobacterium]RDB33299.1 LacI family transcriptional regulator [Exiguobacterium sp. RIT594]